MALVVNPTSNTNNQANQKPSTVSFNTAKSNQTNETVQSTNQTIPKQQVSSSKTVQPELQTVTKPEEFNVIAGRTAGTNFSANNANQANTVPTNTQSDLNQKVSVTDAAKTQTVNQNKAASRSTQPQVQQNAVADKQVAASGNVNPATPIKTYDGLKEQTFTTDKAVYNPGDTVKINLGLQNNQKFDQWGTYKVNVYNPLTNEKTVASGSWKTAKNGGTDNINVDWVTPKVDNQGYIINVQLYTSTGALLDEFDNAVDVDSDPYRHPRYGALTDFSGNDIQSELGSVDSFAKNYHLDMQMLYDCYFRPQNPIPSNMSSWTDWHNDNISKNAIQQIVNRIHQDGSKAWLYDMINAITGKPGDANADLNGIGATEQNGQVVTQTGLFYPKGSSQAGQQYHVTLGNNSDTDIQWYNDPANPQWQNYFIPKIKAALKEIGFDGWQGDTNGQMIGTTYQNRNTNKTINDADFYYYFVQAVEKAFGNQYGFGLNAVNNVGQNSIATKSKPTIDYTELWPDSFPTYGDIANVIEKNWQNDGKPLVVPAYFMDQWRNNASGGKGDALPKTYNDNAVRQLIATIMANGGSPMVLSDGGYLLDDEYYPWPRLEKGKQINMDNNLGNPINGYMRHYWDFDTGYENLLQNPALKSNNNYIQVWNGNGVNQGQCINKNDAESNTVYAFSKSNGSNLDTLNLVNLMGSTNKWQVYNNQDNNSHNIQPQKNLWIKYYPSEQNANIKHVYVSSPDPYYQGKRIELPFKEYTDPSGHKYVEFEVPSLDVWDLVYMTATDPQNTIAGQTTPSTNKPNTNKPANSTTNNKPNASQNKPAGTTATGKPSGTTKPATNNQQPAKGTNNSNSKPAAKPGTSNSPATSTGSSANKPATGTSQSGSSNNNSKPASSTNGSNSQSKPTTNSQPNSNHSGSSASTPSKIGTNPTPAGSKNSGTTNQPAGTSKVSNGTKTNSVGTNAPVAGTTDKSGQPSSTTVSTEQPIKVTVHYVAPNGKVIGTVIDTIQPNSTLDVSKKVPKGYEVSSAFKPQTGVQANNDQATLNVPVVPVGQGLSTSSDKQSASVSTNKPVGKSNIQNDSGHKGNSSMAESIKKVSGQGQAKSVANKQNGQMSGSQSGQVKANGVSTFNVVGNAQQAIGVSRNAEMSAERGSRMQSVGSVQRSSSSSKALSSNALPETGMANEGIEFAAAMLALAGTVMMKKEKQD